MMKDLIFQQPQQQQHVVAVEENISNLTSASGEAAASVSSDNRGVYPQQYLSPPTQVQAQAQSQPAKKKRNLPGNPDPDAEVIALSPKSLMATNRFVCDICNKGFQRDQNLQLHRRGHNLPWKLKQRTSKEIRKKVYVCPETSCVHHDPSKALGDLTGIKKHFCRKHGEKKWKCDKCSKLYAVKSDLKAHSKTCGTREYRCDCGTLFSRRDSYITHRSLCDALAEESARVARTGNTNPIFSFQPGGSSSTSHHHQINLQTISQQQQQQQQQQPRFDQNSSSHGMLMQQQPFALKKEPQTFDHQWLAFQPHHRHDPSSSIFSSTRFNNNQELLLSDESTRIITNPNPNDDNNLEPFPPPFHHHLHHQPTPMMNNPPPPPPHISATALLQKATQMGAITMSNSSKTSSSVPAMFGQGQGSGPHQAHVSAESSNNNNSTLFGLNMSSREDLASGFVYNFGNKATTTCDDDAGATGTAVGTTGHGGPLFQDMIMTSLSSSASGFDHQGSTFEDAFGGFLNNPKRDVHDEPTHRFSRAEDGGDGPRDGMTRDFLGLRPLSHGEIFNIAGLGNCMNTSNGDRQQNQNEKPWQE